jgi:uncharacterized protein
MRILLTGSTGMLGQALGRRLAEEGHELVSWVRDPVRSKTLLSFPSSVFPWGSDVGPCDAVIHLAGENISESRWTDARKKALLDSRVGTTRMVVSYIENLPMEQRPKVFLSASATGIYGDTNEAIVDESSVVSKGFVAELCVAWEAEALKAPSSVRTVLLRTGVVMSAEGGALKKMLPIYFSGIGGPIGTGTQYMSWIGQKDWVNAALECLNNPHLNGPVNLVAPEACRDLELSRAVARYFRTGSFASVPKFALKIAFGELSSLLLTSSRVYPKKLLDLGFQFQSSNIEAAIADIAQWVEHPFGLATVTQYFLAYQYVDHPLDQVFPFFSDAKNLEKITPDFLGFKIVSMSTPQIEKDSIIRYRLSLHGLPLSWVTRIAEWNPPHSFVDNQESGPYKLWYHEHTFSPLGRGTLMRDWVRYEIPMDLLGRIVGGAKIRHDVGQIFDHRRKVIAEIF